MTSRPAPTTRPGRDEPAGSAVVCDDRAVLQALGSACHLHEGPVTVLELVWAWAADLWLGAVTDPSLVVAMALPHTRAASTWLGSVAGSPPCTVGDRWSAPGTRPAGSRSNRPTQRWTIEISRPIRVTAGFPGDTPPPMVSARGGF